MQYGTVDDYRPNVHEVEIESYSTAILHQNVNMLESFCDSISKT